MPPVAASKIAAVPAAMQSARGDAPAALDIGEGQAEEEGGPAIGPSQAVEAAAGARGELAALAAPDVFQELHRAVQQGQLEPVRQLIAAGASVNGPIMCGGHFVTLLHVICARPDLPNGAEILGEILRARANLNGRSSFGSTPLARACFHKHTGAVALLLEARADTSPVDDQGHTVLHCAISLEALPEGHARCGPAPGGPAVLAPGGAPAEGFKAASGELVSLLAASGAKFEDGGPASASPLHMAILGCNRPGVTALLQGGARPACLHTAVEHAPAGIIEDLLKGQANPFEPDAEGKTVLDIAFRRGDEEVISLLRDFIGELERQHLSGAVDLDRDRPSAPAKSSRSARPRLAGVRADAGEASARAEDAEDELTLGLSTQTSGGVQRTRSGLSAAGGEEHSGKRRSFSQRWSIAPNGVLVPSRRRSERASSWLYQARERALQALQGLQAFCQKLSRSHNLQLVTLAALIVVLFLPDLWILFDAVSDSGLDWVLVAVFALFAVELVVQAIGTPRAYFNSFFFWMDIVGLLSVPLDHSLVADSLPPSLDNTVVARAARTARLGARAGRFMKLVKLLRFLPGVHQEPCQEGPRPGTAKSVSSAVMTSLSTRVSCLIIVMVMVLPLFEMATYPENDNSMKAWVDSLDFVRSRYGGDALAGRLTDLESFFSDKDYHPFEVSWHGDGGGTSTARLGGSRPRRQKNEVTVEASSGGVRAVFNFGPQNRVDALCNIVLVMVVIMLMMGFSLLLSKSVSTIVLEPLENLLRGVKLTASKIFRSVNSIAATAGGDGGGERAAAKAGITAEDKNVGTETELLEKIIDKLAALSTITMKASPVDPATLELLGATDHAAVYQGGGNSDQLRRKSRLWSPKASCSSASSEASFCSQQHDRTEELVLEMEHHLEEAGLTWPMVDCWDFDSLEMSEYQQQSVCLCFLVFHLGLAYSEKQQQRLATFLDVACSTYAPPSKVPYHNFCHAVDVSHCLFRILVLCSLESVLSGCERFALMIGAIGHDLGHPGFNNPFLVETAHELAIRYNDQSPLENMHCARLFEIARCPEAAAFYDLDRKQYREARQVCVEAILHTDNVHHFTMVKEMQMLYEMSSEVFDVSLQIHQTSPGDFPPREWVDVLSEPDKKKLLRSSLLHFSDVSNPTKPFPVCKKWAWLIMDEFFQQGDREKELGITVQPLNDRGRVNKPYSQVGFIEFFVAPFAFATVRLLPPLVPCTDQMMLNLDSWCEEWSATTVPAPDDCERARLRERVARLEAKFVFRDGF